MGISQLEEKKAVEAGYWSLYRYNPDAPEGTNPFTLDSKEPTSDFKTFLLGEIRYATLKKQFPDIADELLDKAQSDAQIRRETYKKLAE